MVSPDSQLLDVSDTRVSSESELGEGSIMIESRHSGELAGWDSFSGVLEDKTVSVGWVSDNNSLAGSLGVVVHCFADSNEDFTIIFDKISSFHTCSSWLGSNHEGIVDVLESRDTIGAADNLVEKWESAVMKLGHNTLKSLFGMWEINQMDDNSLLRSKESS